VSYILEALKKSEQERQQGDVPGLQTVQPLLLDSSQPSKWPYVVITVLALSLVFVLGWMRPWAQQQEKLAGSQEAIVERGQADIEQQTSTQAQMPVAEPAVIMPQPVIVKKQVPVEPSLSLDTVPHLRDMPSLMQQAIPNMEFAGHVYSSNPEQRSVIINGSSMAEGETVIDDLKVEQITNKGVVFSFQNHLFQMPILQDWAFD